MSYQLLKSDVLFYQRFLRSTGFYQGILDGEWGPKTHKADTDFLAQSVIIAQQHGSFDTRSEANIITLIPKAQIEARKFLKLARANKDVRILSGTRTYDEQDILYNKGRNGHPGPIVTNATGGQSNHNFGIAWDIGIFDNQGKYITTEGEYKLLGSAIMPGMTTIEWGGDWTSFKDFPHYQLKAVNSSISAIRNHFEKGETYA
jgi:peptidoglycan L-alanyl-D-glutamate endopeptidase CwlK